MGADIHMVLEKRYDGHWIGVHAFPHILGEVYDFDRMRGGDAETSYRMAGSVHWPPKDRSYRLFAALAGVRGDGPSPKGVPDDASALTMIEVEGWGINAHSHSWMLLSEALPIFIRYGQLGEASNAVMEAFGRGIEPTLARYANYFWPVRDDESLDDYRLIFWFDS